MPIYSRGIHDAAKRDLQRLVAGRSPSEINTLRHCSSVLIGMLRYDADQLGQPVGADGRFRVYAWGLRMIFHVRPPEDRYAELVGLGMNAEWEP